MLLFVGTEDCVSEEENEDKMEASLPLPTRRRRNEERCTDTADTRGARARRQTAERGAQSRGSGPAQHLLSVSAAASVAAVSAVRAVVREGHWRTTRHEDPGNIATTIHCHRYLHCHHPNQRHCITV